MTKKKTAKKTAKKTTAKKTTAKKKAAKSSRPSEASKKIDEKIAKLGDWRGEMLARIRKLIHEADPEVVEEWKWMGSPVWSHEGNVVVGNAHKDKVKLTFAQGAKLTDPNKLFNAGLGGNQWRAIDLHEGDRLAAPAFKALIREAVAYNIAKKTAKKK